MINRFSLHRTYSFCFGESRTYTPNDAFRILFSWLPFFYSLSLLFFRTLPESRRALKLFPGLFLTNFQGTQSLNAPHRATTNDGVYSQTSLTASAKHLNPSGNPSRGRDLTPRVCEIVSLLGELFQSRQSLMQLEKKERRFQCPSRWNNSINFPGGCDNRAP